LNLATTYRCLVGGTRGDKMLECEIYPRAFNHLSLNDLVSAIRQVDWDDPGSVQLFVQSKEEDRLSEVNLGLTERV